MLQNLEYFFYGYPPGPYGDIYGLYQPVADCFLICTPHLRTAIYSKILLSSKYSLHIVKLNSAQNYQLNIIDNLVCENWTLSNRANILINWIEIGTQIIEAEQLCSTTPKIALDWEQEKTYAMFCAHWFEKLDDSKGDDQKFIELVKFDSTLCDDSENKLKSQIFDVLHRGRDIFTVNQHILNLINDHTKNNLSRSKSISSFRLTTDTK